MKSNNNEILNLGEIVKIKYGKDHKKLSNGCIPVYGTGGIMRYADKYIYDKKSVLIPRKGSLGNLYFVDEPFWTVDTLFYTEIDESKILPEFLYYKLKTYDLSSMNVGSAVPSLTVKVLDAIKIDLPTIEKQQSIVKILKSIDDKIEINKKINHHLEQLAHSIFKSWFVDFEPFNGKIPTDWTKSNLSGIANYLNGLAMQRFRPLDKEEGIPVLKIKELRQGSFDFSSDLCSPNIKDQYIVQDGDVIFSWSGSLLVDFWTGGLGGLNQHLFKVFSENYDKWFYFSWTQHHLEEFSAMAAARATTMGHITRDALDKAEVLIPNKTDYKKLGDLLDPIYNKQIANRLENRKLTEIRDSLLPKLLSGEIEIR